MYLFNFENSKQECVPQLVCIWTEHQPANQRLAGSIPSQGTGLGCGPGPQWGPHERQPHIDISLPISLPFCLKINE